MTRNRTQPSIHLPARKQALFSFIVVGGFFLLVEIVLWVVGIEPLPGSKDPYVGFSSSLPLFVESESPEGEPYLKTAPNKLHWFNPMRFSRRKSATGYRVFTLGGSTTYGRPYTDALSFSGWLREYLPLADPGRQWEVINAGGISYASYRIAVLMEELLDYQPDLFIVYTGHNEFLERRTYSGLLNAPRWVTTVAGWASRTRLYAAGQKLVDTAAGTGKRPSKLAGEVDTILEHAVGPEAYHRDDALREQVFEHFRHNLNRMVDLARSAGAEIVFVTPASNLKDCSPFKSKPGEAAKGVAPMDEAALESSNDLALERLAEAVSSDPRNAELQYRLGLALYESGRYQEAKTAFLRAVDEDICPLRAPARITEIIREVADDRQVPLVDFARVVESRAPHGIPGAGQFVDHVHLNAEGYGLIAREIVAELVRQRAVELSGAWNEENLDAARLHVLAKLDRQAYGESLLNLGQVMAWAGKLDEAERFVREAEEILGASPNVNAILGHTALADGELDSAIRLLTEALRVRPNLAFARLDLGTAYYLTGRFEESASELKQAMSLDPATIADARNKLGLCYHALGDRERALAEYRAVLQTVPDHVDARNNLGVTLLALGRPREAMEEFRRVIDLDPAPKAFFNLGAALEALGDHKTAAAQFREAARLNPDYAEANNSLGLNLMLLGQIEPAVEALGEATRIRPGYAEAHDHLGSAYLLAGREEQAIQEFEQAIRFRDGWAPPLAHLAELLSTPEDERLRNTRRAIDLAEQAAALTQRSNYEVLEVLALCYSAAGRFSEGSDAAREALDLANDAGDAAAETRLRRFIDQLRNQSP